MRRRIALLLVVASGTGLVGTGLVLMWRATRDAQRALELDAHDGAEACARLLREALADPAWVEQAPEALRYVVEDGRVVVPEGLGWFAEPPARPAPAPRVARALAGADALEFGQGDTAGARVLLEQALGAGDDPGLWLALGWCADRAGDAEARCRALAHADQADAESWLLLGARSGAPLPEWAGAAVTRLDRPRGEALLARLRELGRGQELAPLERSLGASSAARARLRAAAAAWASGEPPRAGVAGADVVLSRVDGPGRGGGAVADARAFCGAVRARSPLPSTGRVVLWGEAAGAAGPGGELAGAVPVVPGRLGVVPEPARAPSPLGGPLALSALLVALAAAFGGGTLVVLRALREETRATAARAEFLTSVTHELKTPLAGIRLLAEMLDEGIVTAPEKRAAYHRMISGETMRLTSLIENVLDLGRMERGERAYDLRESDLAAVVRTVVELFEVIATRAGLAVTLAAPQEPLLVRLDRAALAQALFNVLDNARKYAAGGGSIEVSVARDGDRAALVVRDHGPGIDAEEREAVFERFARGKAQKSGSVPGLGLGLHLARTIARAHDGELTCEAPRDGGRGAVLRFSLRLAEAPA